MTMETPAAISVAPRRLLVLTGVAAVVATAITFLAFLPAEYGYDPTGFGQLTGLNKIAAAEPVTVAANAQKQVALLVKDRVPYERIYALSPNASSETREPTSVAIKLRMKNLKPRGLGVPLPSGTVTVFETVRDRPMMVGEPHLADTAVGEDVELEVGASPDVTFTQTLVSEVKGDRQRKTPRRYKIELANARSSPSTVEVELRVFGKERLVKPSRRLGIKNGRSFWKAVVPANGRETLTYTIERMRAEDGVD